jgi:hypothetical protein
MNGLTMSDLAAGQRLSLLQGAVEGDVLLETSEVSKWVKTDEE